MLLLKHFCPNLARERYRTYRRVNALFCILFFCALLIGIALSTTYILSADGIDSSLVFALHWPTRISGGILPFSVYGFCSLLPYFLLSLVFGITIYAPVVNGLCVLLSAFSIGAYLRFLLGFLYLQKALWPFVYCLLSFVPIALLMCASFAFSTAVSFRIFTPKDPTLTEAEQPFGGTLFCAPYFAKTINFRFLCTYLLCFLGFVILLFALCVLQAVMVLKL